MTTRKTHPEGGIMITHTAGCLVVLGISAKALAAAAVAAAGHLATAVGFIPVRKTHYLRVANLTEMGINFHCRFHKPTADGIGQWRPHAEDDAFVFYLDPKTAGYAEIDGVTVDASRANIWAWAADNSYSWDAHEDEPWILTPVEYKDVMINTATYRFNLENGKQTPRGRWKESIAEVGKKMRPRGQ